MSYDAKLDGMLALTLGISTGNASEGLETVRDMEQKSVKNSRRLPKEMYPSKAAFEDLGFTFTDTGDEILYEATLPEGWKTVETPGSSILWENLVDDKGRVRGNYCYKGAFYDRYGVMNLKSRYNSTYELTKPNDWDSPVNVVVKDADGTIIFHVGQCEKMYSDKYFYLLKKGEEFLNSNYPDWKDPTKYWD